MFTVISSKDLNCSKYRIGSWWHDTVYGCSDKSTKILFKNDTKITGRSGVNHVGFKTDADVGSLGISDTEVHYFPTNIESVFPNLIAIIITDCNLLEVHQSDLKPFSKLEKLLLNRNQITFLEQDLFKFNPNIIRLGFADNKIVHVESSVFVGLKSLKFLDFRNNPCHSDTADTRFNVLNLELSIQLNCHDKETYKKLREKN